VLFLAKNRVRDRRAKKFSHCWESGGYRYWVKEMKERNRLIKEEYLCIFCEWAEIFQEFRCHLFLCLLWLFLANGGGIIYHADAIIKKLEVVWCSLW
jgi:hypothetical protein